MHIYSQLVAAGVAERNQSLLLKHQVNTILIIATLISCMHAVALQPVSSSPQTENLSLHEGSTAMNLNEGMFVFSART